MFNMSARLIAFAEAFGGAVEENHNFIVTQNPRQKLWRGRKSATLIFYGLLAKGASVGTSFDHIK